MRWSAPLLIALLLAAGPVGCRSTQRVEEDLRNRENQLRAAKQDIDCLRAQNWALQNEVRLQRGEVPQPFGAPPPLLTYPVREVTLGARTGGYEPDGRGGDIGLQVILEPRDIDQHVIKAPGRAEIEAYELPREGARHLLSKWTLDEDQLRASWKQTWLTTGYVLILPWQTPPTTPKLYVIARFITPDGHIFEAGAGKEVTVKLLSGGVRPPPAPGPVPGSGESHEPPPAGPKLPAPTPEGPGTPSARWWVLPNNPLTPAPSAQTTSAYPPHPPTADLRPRYLPTEPEPIKPPVKPVGAWDPGW